VQRRGIQRIEDQAARRVDTLAGLFFPLQKGLELLHVGGREFLLQYRAPGGLQLYRAFPFRHPLSPPAVAACGGTAARREWTANRYTALPSGRCRYPRRRWAACRIPAR